MPYQSDSSTVTWFEMAVRHPLPRVRMRAVELLEYAAVPNRSLLLRDTAIDADPRVAATSALVAACLEVACEEGEFELFESDFGEGLEAGDLEWEWEYAVRVCRGCYVPSGNVAVWTRREDDDAARSLALMRLCLEDGDEKATPIIVGRRLVTRYTRSPRSASEARSWGRQGRPRYGDL